MKAVIFAGGLGTRLAEETLNIPKPMVPIGPEPILWHIMKMYAHHGIKDFVICLGYKGQLVKDYFANFALRHDCYTLDLATGQRTVHRKTAEDWRITVVDTGLETLTGGRLKRVAEFIKDEDAFCLTYGDAVADLDIAATIQFHRAHGKLATVTAVKPLARFGALTLQGDAVTEFAEKPEEGLALVNGGFFVLSPKVLNYIPDHEPMWEQEPLRDLARDGQLQAYSHLGFWHCMDTLKHRQDLEAIWARGNAPWALWEKRKA